MEKKHKGQVGSLQGVIAVLLVVGVLIATAFFVLEEFSQQDQFFDNTAVTNETQAFANGTAPEYVVARESGSKTSNFVVTDVWTAQANETGYHDQLNSSFRAFMTITDRGVLALTGNTTAVNQTVFNNLSISYTVDEGQEGWQGVNDTVEALNTVPDLLGLIILIVIVGIVLAVIFNVVPGTRVSGA